ncbi:hypothetical protein [Paraburkholderia sp. JHI869]|uniref:hypothetical protein n=1 Tax=Paraburkholderia sp. JHI869 TaxID=3112959 RepID=UPI0031732A57
MLRTLVEHSSRFSAFFPVSSARCAILRGGAILIAAVLAFMLAPHSTRANLALCIGSQSKLLSENRKMDSHGTRSAQSLAIERCID